MNSLLSQEQIIQGGNIIQTSLVIDSEVHAIKIKKIFEKFIKNDPKNNSTLWYAQGYMLMIISKWLPPFLKAKEIELVLVFTFH